MSSLGIYFGPDLISIVETKGRKILNHVKIPLATFSGAELEEKVPDEIKMVALFKDEMRRNKIEAKEINLTLSGKDLIIRTFEIPLLPREELDNAINFESRKYIPFKVEDLILDYQLYFDKSTQKNLVLLMGIKKEILDKQLSVFKQLELEIASLEYSAFSTLRLLKLAKLKDKGIKGFVEADLLELDEINFTVLENGFPLFSRDIILRGESEGLIRTEEIDSSMLLEKFKTEMRISLDYYHRKFPSKKIEKTFFILNKDFQSDLEAFAKELDLDIQFIEVNEFLGKPVAFSLSFLKAYATSLVKIIKIPVKVNLLVAKTRVAKEAVIPYEAMSTLYRGLHVEARTIILALLICVTALLFGFFQKLSLQKELNTIRKLRPQVSLVNPDASYEELINIASVNKAKVNTLENLFKKQLYLTEVLDVIPRIIPEGMWLEGFSFKKEETDKVEVLLDGMASLVDSNKEFELVNDFLSRLKENPHFSKYFQEMKIVSLDRGSLEDMTVTKFSISCRSHYKEKN